ncbi:MAG: M20/M25/M40 family metallo-hydrolase [Bacteroidetes bacterium]|nr:M20/M25/M40 family metallo-hydrolase [Bacteroidota bacterium]HET6243959.1 M20/M25/M40 family metallo-hydrolase [Bacteroidia bacterium]
MENVLKQEKGIPIINYTMDELYRESLNLLKELIAVESFSKQEDKSAEILSDFFSRKRISHQRKSNNLWAFNRNFNPKLPTILLNAHHDTIRPAFGWSINPFFPLIENGKIYGLGSNNAGAALVSLITTFLYFNEYENLKYNLVFAATSEVEISGNNGMKQIFSKLGEIDFAIIGEPTKMQLIIAEKALLVLECVAHTKPGFSIQENEGNAIEIAMNDIAWFRNFKHSNLLSPLKIVLTNIETTNTGDNVSKSCKFTVEVRTGETFDIDELLELIGKNIFSEIKVLSSGLNSDIIDKSHPLISAGTALGRNILSSRGTRDKALIDVPSLILGPGDPARSYTCDEFVYLYEINEGISMYIAMLSKLLQ